ELPQCRSMSALIDIVVSLQRRIGVDDRSLLQNQVAIDLTGICLLRIRADNDRAVENAARSIVENAFVQLETVAVRLHVVDDRMIINTLTIAQNEEAIQRKDRPFAGTGHNTPGGAQRS